MSERVHWAESSATADRVVEIMRDLQGTWVLHDDDKNTLNSAAHVLYRIAERLRTGDETPR